MYKVLQDFYDLQDDNYAYHAGDTFPRDGVKPTKKRLSELAGTDNQLGVSLIAIVKESKEEE